MQNELPKRRYPNGGAVNRSPYFPDQTRVTIFARSYEMV